MITRRTMIGGVPLGAVDAGRHVVRIWRLDDTVILQTLVLG